MPDATYVERLRTYGIRLTEFDQSKKKDLITNRALREQITGGYCLGACIDWLRRVLIRDALPGLENRIRFDHPDNPRRIERMATVFNTIGDTPLAAWQQHAADLDANFQKKDASGAKGFRLIDALRVVPSTDLNWSDLAESSAGHPDLTAETGIVLTLDTERKVGQTWESAPKHTVAFFAEGNGSCALFDPNLGVFQFSARRDLLVGLCFLFGYAYEEPNGRVKTPPGASWTIFRRKNTALAASAAAPAGLGALKEFAKKAVLEACAERSRESTTVLQKFEHTVDERNSAEAAFQRSGLRANTAEHARYTATSKAYDEIYDEALAYARAHSLMKEFNRINDKTG
jgi:hypothetical protein